MGKGGENPAMSMRHNINKDPEMCFLFREALNQAEEELESHACGSSIGIAHLVHARAREIFKDKYGVEWPKPPEDPLDRLIGNIRN
jgi:hypothetical protein